MDNWKNWKYKNLTFLVLSILVFIYFIDSPLIQESIKKFGAYGYVSSFVCGVLFVSVFTVAPSAAIIYDLANTLDPILIAITAGIGAVIGDYFIFKFLKDGVFDELSVFFQDGVGLMIKKLFLSPFFSWFIPIIGLFIIASPFPDEVGLGLIGLSKIKTWQFILITFLLNSLGIFGMVIIATLR